MGLSENRHEAENKYRDIKVGIATLGCKVNQYESEAVAEKFAAAGFSVCDSDAKCDIYVINTCTVTAESDRKARQTIRRMMGENPNAFILVTGCYAQTAPEKIAKIGGVDYICGSDRKNTVVDYAENLISAGHKNGKAEINVGDISKSGYFEPMSIEKFDRTRAYIKIEDGCISKCTYCRIPAARGSIRSKPKDDVLAEFCSLSASGCREIVLTGIETASYGFDFSEKYRLIDLLSDIDKLPGAKGCRVRLGSLDPSLITPDFVAVAKNLSSLTPHYHLSMQSGSDRILALMRRKYRLSRATEGIKLLRENINGVQFTTDIIVGFPGETEEDFADTVRLIEEVKFLGVHIFTYSPREGTAAAEMKEQIPENVKKERAAFLAEKQKAVKAKILEEQTGKKFEVLFESRDADGIFTGHTPSYIEVGIASDENLHSQVRKIEITGNDGEKCLGREVIVND